jgi:hypothetical protein
MPYQISLDNNVLQIMLNGRITGSDLQAIVDETINYDRAALVPHRVTDMSAITELSIGFPDVLAVAERRRILKFPNPYKSAIVAPQSEHVGFARMMQTLNDNPQVAIKVFSNRQDAINWIAATGPE